MRQGQHMSDKKAKKMIFSKKWKFVQFDRKNAQISAF